MPASAQPDGGEHPRDPGADDHDAEVRVRGVAVEGSAGPKPMSSAAIGPYSGGTGSPTARSISSISSSPVGAGSAGGRPPLRQHRVDGRGPELGLDRGGKPPVSLSSMPRLRVGR